MLAHSLPFPLIICYNRPNRTFTTKDEEGILLALQHRDRVQVIYLKLPVPTLQKLIITMDDEFPALEYIHIGPPTKHDSHLTLPPTFEAPHLRRISTRYLASSISSTLLSTAVGLVELSLDWIHPSTYPHPNDFLQQLSLLPQLRKLIIRFCSPAPNRDIERQLLHTPVTTTHLTLPSLRIFVFLGISAFLETILPHMAAPLLETFRTQFSDQLPISVPHLPQFMMTTEKLRFTRAKFTFHHEAVVLFTYPQIGSRLNSEFNIGVSCRHLDGQVSSMAQISNVLYPLFSKVVDLTLDYRKHTLSSEQHNQADYAQWRVLLGSFRNVETLRVHNGLAGEISHALQTEEPLEVLPKLKELVCPVGRVDDKIFALYIHQREVAGQPVSLVGEAFPTGHTHYIFYSSTGDIDIRPD
jgi:hypothetical protein